MSFSSKVLYTGDAVTTDFTVTFPYISQSHVSVYVNEILQLNPMNYVWSGASTISFGTAPGIDDAIEIRRWTSPSSTLVDFTDGSTLRANDLDTAYLHNYYLSQEYADSFNEVINEMLIRVATAQGITETDPDQVILELVADMVNSAAAANLQARITDIDANAEAIITLGDALQVQINTLATGIAAQVFIQPGEPVPGVGGVPDPISEGARWYDSDDNNHPYIYQSSAWLSIDDPRVGQLQTDLSVLNTEVDDNAAAVIAESVARSNADSAFASQLDLLGAQNGAQTAFIIDLDTVQITDGVESLADRFTSLQAQITTNDSTGATNAASIISEQTVRADADIAIASDVTALTARVTTAEGDIVSQAASISSITADVTAAEGDIIANASDISGLLVTVDLRATTFFQASAPSANNTGDLWIDSDNDNLHRWNGSSWVLIQDAAIAGNASAITAIDTRVTSAEGTISSHSSSISTINASVTTLQGDVDSAEITIAANVSAISDAETDITDLYAKYGVTLNVNGYVTGFAQNNDGTTGTFVILADKFAIVDPSGDPGETEYVPFEISGGKINMRSDVKIDGDLLVTGTINGTALVNGTIGSTQIGANAISTSHISANAITANEIEANAVTAAKINVTNLAAVNADLGSITAGNITLNTAGYIKGGQTAYNTGTGFFLGYNGGAYKFSIGNGTTNYMTWDGTDLTIKGDLVVGEYELSDNIILSATTERTDSGAAGSYQTYKTFTVAKDGDVRVTVEYKHGTFTGGVVTACNWRVTVNGALDTTWSSSSTTSYATRTINLTGLSAGDVIDIDMIGGTRNPSEPLNVTAYVRNAYVKADVVIAPGGSVDLN